MEVTAKETQRRGPTEELRTGLQEVPRLTAGRGQGGGARNEGRDSWIVGALAPRRPDLRPRQNGQSKSWKRQRQTENSSETSAGHPPAACGVGRSGPGGRTPGRPGGRGRGLFGSGDAHGSRRAEGQPWPGAHAGGNGNGTRTRASLLRQGDPSPAPPKPRRKPRRPKGSWAAWSAQTPPRDTERVTHSDAEDTTPRAPGRGADRAGGRRTPGGGSRAPPARGTRGPEAGRPPPLAAEATTGSGRDPPVPRPSGTFHLSAPPSARFPDPLNPHMTGTVPEPSGTFRTAPGPVSAQGFWKFLRPAPHSLKFTAQTFQKLPRR